MKRQLYFTLSLCLVLGLVFGATFASADEQKPFFVHFVVVPSATQYGAETRAAILKFEEEVILLAGGFTELGPSRGGSIENGVVKPQENLSFIIGADRDVSKELKALSRKIFKDDGAFILAWPGKVIF